MKASWLLANRHHCTEVYQHVFWFDQVGLARHRLMCIGQPTRPISQLLVYFPIRGFWGSAAL
jgi:uncharacterized protein YcfL